MTPWAQATLAIHLLNIDPIGLGGLNLRARSGPVRDKFLKQLPKDIVKLHPSLGPQELEPNIDMSQTLAAGAVVYSRGVLEKETPAFVLTMAERCDAYLAYKLAQEMDTDTKRYLLSLDEGADPEETTPPALRERMAFQFSLNEVSLSDAHEKLTFVGTTETAPITTSDAAEQLVALAVKLGIQSLRAPSLALRAAQAMATFSGRNSLLMSDVETAVSLVYSARATRLPADDPAPENEAQNDEKTSQNQIDIPEEILLEAVKTTLPDDVLNKLSSVAKISSKGSGAGQKKTGNRRGRPLPARNRTAKKSARIDIIATLRAAVPWQTLRKVSYPNRRTPIILPDDLRERRYEEKSDRLLIFSVDASGSTAIARLAEAKGAIELLLAQAYASRDHVALIAFRGEEADLLLPPTRSLVQTKKQLASLPGGGATPLAHGMQKAMEVAELAQKKGLTPTMIFLTDGKGNVALDGTKDRQMAAADSQRMADCLRSTQLASITIDTGRRTDPALAALAANMGARYISLPRANADLISKAVATELDG